MVSLVRFFFGDKELSNFTLLVVIAKLLASKIVGDYNRDKWTTATFERSTLRRLDGMVLPGESRSRALNRILRKYQKAVKSGKIVEGSAETKSNSQLNNDLAVWQIHDRIPASVEELTKLFSRDHSLGVTG